MDLWKHTFSRFFTLSVIFCVALCTAAFAETVRSSKQGNDENLIFGYSSQLFYNVDPKDLISLLEVFTQMTNRKLDPSLKATTVVYNNLSDTENALSKKEVDVLVMIPEEFTRLRASFHLIPILSADYGNRFYNELLLLVREDSGIKEIGHLRGKSLLLDVGQQGSIPIKWLDSILKQRFMSNTRVFFSKTQENKKSSKVIMPVFFGQVDACLVSRNSYEMLVEQNPQIGHKLLILERSPGFVTGILAARNDIGIKRRDAIIKVLTEMHTDPKGKQILTLFRINRLVPFLPEHLASVSKVLKESRTQTEINAKSKM